MKLIKQSLKDYKIQFSIFSDYKINPHAVEAVSFAFMAHQCIQKKTNNVPQVTGASQETILGKIVYP